MPNCKPLTREEARLIVDAVRNSPRNATGFKVNDELLGQDPDRTARKPSRTVLSIQDVDALSPEKMRWIIKEIIALQRLDQIDSLSQIEITVPSDLPTDDPVDTPKTGIKGASANRGTQNCSQCSRDSARLDQPDGSNLSHLATLRIRVDMLQPSAVRPLGESDSALQEICIPLHVDATVFKAD